MSLTSPSTHEGGSNPATGPVRGDWRNPHTGPDWHNWSPRPGVPLSPRPAAATIARDRRQLQAEALHGGTPLNPQTNTHIHKGFHTSTTPRKCSGPGLPRLPVQRPWCPKSSVPRGEPCLPSSSTRLPGGGLGRQCTRRVHGAGGLRAGLCRRPSEALAAAPPSSFTFSALTHRPPTPA